MKQRRKTKKKIQTLWGSAFEEGPDKAAIAYTSGRDVHTVPAADYKLLPYDIWLNRAHAIMLYKQKIMAKSDAQAILGGLKEIEKLAASGKFVLHEEKEDVHTNIESWLTEKYGIKSAGKLHTARSRNDQASADVRLYVRDQVVQFAELTNNLIDELLKKADLHKKTVMPGFTHHQHAMVTTFGHILMAFASMLLRDVEKFKSAYALMDENLLGNAAAYGTSFPIARDLTTKYLGFSRIDANSLDAITNRWESEADVAFATTSLMNHLSIMAETLILLSTTEFDMVKLSDKYSTGSSIMPQKKNPDTLEATKGKAGLAAGYLQSLVSMGRAAFIGYNRDSQWTKYIIMDIVDECQLAPPVMKGIIQTLKVHAKKMKRWSKKGFIGATSLLETMCVTYNVPFRQGKIVLEKAIKYSTDRDIVEFGALRKALAEEGVKIDITEEHVLAWQDPEKIILNYKSYGSPNPKKVTEAIGYMRVKNKKNKDWLVEKTNQKQKALDLLEGEIQKILKA